MRLVWDDLDARARGLATHLFGRRHLENLARTADLRRLAEEIQSAGYGPIPEPPERGSAPGAVIPTPASLEIGLRRGAATRLARLARWCAGRIPGLGVVFEDEDRRSLRALLRGAMAHVAPEERLSGLIPTPGLPEGLLRELAREPAPASLAARLVTWGHPYGSALLAEAAGSHPDLFRLELALNRAFAARARRTSARALRPYVRHVVDLENACSALMLAGRGVERDVAGCFLSGGRRVGRHAFLAAAAADDPGAAARRIASSFEGTPFAEIFRRHSAGRASLEADILAAQIRLLLEDARLHPLGPSPLLGYLLRLRAEAIDLRRILWGLFLQAPREELASGLLAAP